MAVDILYLEVSHVKIVKGGALDTLTLLAMSF